MNTGAAIAQFLFSLFGVMLEQVSPFIATWDLQTPLVLLILVALEAILSADNAIALAAIAQGLHDEKLQRQALNWGLVAAYGFRVLLIFTATWIVQFWQFELLGAAYLLWLVFQYFTSAEEGDPSHHGPALNSLWQAIPLIAITDLAFSLDSVTTAIAVADQTWLILLGGLVGVITLRFLAGLFMRWLEEFVYLEDAAFVTVGFVGVRLLLKVVKPEWTPPEWMMIALIAGMFIWGFSKRKPEPLA